MFLSEISGKF
jgi:hypothetical protein